MFLFNIICKKYDLSKYTYVIKRIQQKKETKNIHNKKKVIFYRKTNKINT